MTPDEIQGPERETSSALSFPAFSLRYSIDWRDALAWETLPAELRGLQYAIYIGFLVAGGMVYGIAAEHLPDWVNRLPHILVLLLIVAVAHGLWMAYFALRQRRLARKRLPRRMVCLFEDWGDHIYLQSEAGEVSLSPDLCRQIVEAPDHLFLDFVGDTLAIVPLAAFETVAQKDTFLAKWRLLTKEAP